MIPDFISEDAPPGEKKLFNIFASDQRADAWIVVHSLRLHDYPGQIQSETDFVVIVPKLGVLVIEVKSHEAVAYRHGRWKLGSRNTSKDPFDQANKAQHAIMNHLEKSSVHILDIHCESCVWFTGSPVRREMRDSIEIADWRILDVTDLDDAVGAVLNCLQRSREHRQQRHQLRLPDNMPTLNQMNTLLQLLRPSIAARFTGKELRARKEHDKSVLLNEQLEFFTMFADNPRVLVRGPAGCGKTFLALHAARQQAEEGKRGLLVCYNRALSLELRELAADIPNLEVDTLASVMMNIAGCDDLDPDNMPPQKFWDDELPYEAFCALADREPLYDYLIVDEAQDLIRDNLVEVLSCLVAGGLEGGRCLYFADFESQNLYNADTDVDFATLLHQPTVFRLTINCRNDPGICDALTTGSRYHRFRRQNTGYHPTVVNYHDEHEQQQKLVEQVKSYIDEGYALSDIVILSPKNDSAAHRCTDSWLAPKLENYKRGGLIHPSKIRYSTIHSFKGLEANVIIMTDLDTSSRPDYQTLVNVGVTRAEERLTLLMTPAGKRQLYG